MSHARSQHPIAPLTPEGRRRMVSCVLKRGWTVEATAERFQVDAKTVRNWRRPGNCILLEVSQQASVGGAWGSDPCRHLEAGPYPPTGAAGGPSVTTRAAKPAAAINATTKPEIGDALSAEHASTPLSTTAADSSTPRSSQTRMQSPPPDSGYEPQPSSAPKG